MRRLGAIPYMTPLQRATESSTTPKSVMKTTVGGGCTADCCAIRVLAPKNVNQTISTCASLFIAELFSRVSVMRIRRSLRKAISLLGMGYQKERNTMLHPLLFWHL